MILPNKELLSAVLGWEVDYIKLHLNLLDIVQYYDKKKLCVKTRDIINIYELAHLCKEWLHAENYMFGIKFPTNTTPHHITVMFYGNVGKAYHCGETEPEAIFKACEWILKEIK